MISRVCGKTFTVLGQLMTVEPIEIDEALGLFTLWAILSAGEVNKRKILLEDWDRVWDKLIPICVHFMIPFFMWSGAYM